MVERPWMHFAMLTVRWCFQSRSKMMRRGCSCSSSILKDTKKHVDKVRGLVIEKRKWVLVNWEILWGSDHEGGEAAMPLEPLQCPISRGTSRDLSGFLDLTASFDLALLVSLTNKARSEWWLFTASATRLLRVS